MDRDPLARSKHGEGVELRDMNQDGGDENGDSKKEELRLLKIRKKQELKLVKKFDKSKINVSKECWFLIDSDWLNAWSEFVNGSEVEDPPGPLSNKELLDSNGNPLPNLKPIRDYRGVPPVVYFIFVELYGRDDSPELSRYVIDIYKTPVTIAKMVNIQVTGRTQAKIEVNRVRPKWVKWEREYEDDEDDGMIWCCGLTKEHLEAFIYWAITCWASSRKKSGRGNISYRKYKPLRMDAAMLEEEEAAARGRAGGGGGGGGDEEGDGVEGGDKDKDEDWLEARRAAEALQPPTNPTTQTKKKTRRPARKAPTAPTQRMDNSVGKSSASVSRSRGVMLEDSSSSDSDCEIEIMLQSAPADTNIESGTWLSASRWWSFGK